MCSCLGEEQNPPIPSWAERSAFLIPRSPRLSPKIRSHSNLQKTLTVANPQPTLTVEGGTTQSLTWTEGNVAPTATITAMSSGAPIEYTVSTTAGTLSPQVASASGLAYSFGTSIPVTFPASVFASALPGQVLTGNAILTWGGGKMIVVTINVTVDTAVSTATASMIVPATLPTPAAFFLCPRRQATKGDGLSHSLHRTV